MSCWGSISAIGLVGRYLYTKPMSDKRINLKTATPEQISAAVADAMGIPMTPEREYVDIDAREITIVPAHHKPYATSADAVLPLLEKAWAWEARRWTDVPHQVSVIRILGEGWSFGTAPTFPLAACIALLRAHGVEVVE